MATGGIRQNIRNALIFKILVDTEILTMTFMLWTITDSDVLYFAKLLKNKTLKTIVI